MEVREEEGEEGWGRGGCQKARLGSIMSRSRQPRWQRKKEASQGEAFEGDDDGQNQQKIVGSGARVVLIYDSREGGGGELYAFGCLRACVSWVPRRQSNRVGHALMRIEFRCYSGAWLEAKGTRAGRRTERSRRLKTGCWLAGIRLGVSLGGPGGAWGRGREGWQGGQPGDQKQLLQRRPQQILHRDSRLRASVRGTRVGIVGGRHVHT